jgi:2-(1,2-epoxy-1,2-dihydrophenyl)acetyl-CoA isomerase
MTDDDARASAGELQAHTIGAARVLLLNRPERRNALVPDVARRLAIELHAAGGDPALRAVVLRGAGGHFCVGLDLKWFLSLGATPAQAVLEEGLAAFQDTVRAVVRCPLPVIAALEGSVAGFGLDLALACDLRIAARTASFASAFARMGLVPDGGSTYTLPRLVGTSRAAALLLGVVTPDAREALELGLVNDVVEPAQLDAAVHALVGRIAESARSSGERIKAWLRADDREALERRLKLEGRAQLDALRSEEFQARLRAFVGRSVE